MFPNIAPTPKSLIVVPLLAVLAATLAFALVASPASAGGGASGGVDLGGEGKQGSEGKRGKNKQSARQKARYRRIYKRVGRRDRRWARKTAECESGRNPKAIGGGGRYRGAFQFMRATWRRAPKSPGGDPIAYNYKTQAVVAIALKRREGRHHWPHCG